jgi:putative nucleotidyltransferase with HDIG domain/diguanylate cyclase (GGDEF)-like protein
MAASLNPKPSSRSSAPRSSTRLAPLAADQLIELGQAAELSGRRSEAREHYEAALHQLRRHDDSVRAATLLRWIARTHTTDADFDSAMECASAALAISQACGDVAGEGHAINVQAAVHWRRAELDLAEELFLKARVLAVQAGDRMLAGMTSHNLGIIAAIRGDFSDALRHYMVGLDHHRALNRMVDVCMVLNNIGRLHTDLHRWDEAEKAYDEAVAISEALGDRTKRIGVEVNRAELWLARGDAGRATASANLALRLSEESGDKAWAAELAKILGVLRRDAGVPVEAERHFAQAVTLAEAQQDSLLLAETLRERAELYRNQGRNREALQNLNRAHRLFEQMRAKRELANVDKSVARLENDFLDVVKRWGDSIEAKDHHTQGHCKRVADLACAVASKSGIEGQSLFWFRIGALLHDVGKLVVPSEVLNKAGKLTPEEWDLMRSHPSAGVDMLAGIDFPWDVRPLIESHHERWDGKGYPHALSGTDIPLSARILAVADVYDALTSVRSYKAASTHEEAMEIMRRDVGAAFDPEVFARFEEVMRDNAPETGTVPATELPRVDLSRGNTLDFATADVLTGLPLRPALARIAEQTLGARTVTGGFVSLLVVDVGAEALDRLRQDRAGPNALLRGVARQMRNATRATDFVARSSEHQFMALLAGSSAADARTVMLRVQNALARVLRRRQVDLESIRLAVVTAPDHGRTAAELLAAAEQAIEESRPAVRGDGGIRIAR